MELHYVLEVQGRIKMINSQSTGNFYATTKKAYVPSVSDEAIYQGLIGTQMQGGILKVEVESYNLRETGEEITLSYKWVYIPEEEPKIEKLTQFMIYC